MIISQRRDNKNEERNKRGNGSGVGVQCRWKGRDGGRAEGEEGRDVGEREG